MRVNIPLGDRDRGVSRDSRQRKHVTARFCQLRKSGVSENVRLECLDFLCAFRLRLRVGVVEGEFVLVLGRVFVEVALDSPQSSYSLCAVHFAFVPSCLSSTSRVNVFPSDETVIFLTERIFPSRLSVCSTVWSSIFLSETPVRPGSPL